MPAIAIILALLTLGLPTPQAIADEPRDPVAIDPIEGIRAALDRHFLIALGENHSHEQFYAWLETLLRDPGIQERVDDIVVEYGNAMYQDVLDRYIRGDEAPLEEVRRIWRDTVVSPNTVWDCPVYEAFFRFVRELNATLPEDRRYRVIAGDPPVDWSNVNTRDDLTPLFDRPAHFAEVVEREVLDKGRRSLLIAGGGHLTRVSMESTNRQGLRWARVTIVAHLELRFPGSTYVVQSMGAAGDAYDAARLAEMPHGALVKVKGTWLGALPANGITTMSNFDGTPFTLYGDATFGDMVDAIIYWGAASEFRGSTPPASIYRDEIYWAELNRRSNIMRGRAMNPALRGES